MTEVPKTYAKLKKKPLFQIRCKKCRTVFTPTYRCQMYNFKCVNCFNNNERNNTRHKSIS